MNDATKSDKRYNFDEDDPLAGILSDEEDEPPPEVETVDEKEPVSIYKPKKQVSFQVDDSGDELDAPPEGTNKVSEQTARRASITELMDDLFVPGKDNKVAEIAPTKPAVAKSVASSSWLDSEDILDNLGFENKPAKPPTLLKSASEGGSSYLDSLLGKTFGNESKQIDSPIASATAADIFAPSTGRQEMSRGGGYNPSSGGQREGRRALGGTPTTPTSRDIVDLPRRNTDDWLGFGSSDSLKETTATEVPTSRPTVPQASMPATPEWLPSPQVKPPVAIPASMQQPASLTLSQAPSVSAPVGQATFDPAAVQQILNQQMQQLMSMQQSGSLLQPSQPPVLPVDDRSSHYLSTMESMSRRHQEEVDQIENSFRKRLAVSEELSQSRVDQLRQEMEQKTKMLQERIVQMQGEMAGEATSYQYKIQQLKSEHSREMEQMRAENRAKIDQTNEEQTHVIDRLQKMHSSEMEAYRQSNKYILSSNAAGGVPSAAPIKEAQEMLIVALEQRMERDRQLFTSERKHLLDMLEKAETRLMREESRMEEERFKLKQAQVQFNAKVKGWDEEKTNLLEEIEREKRNLRKQQDRNLQDASFVEYGAGYSGSQIGVSDGRSFKSSLNHELLEREWNEVEKEKRRMEQQQRKMEQQKQWLDSEGERIKEGEHSIRMLGMEVEKLFDIATKSLEESLLRENQQNKRWNEMKTDFQHLKKMDAHIAGKQSELRSLEERVDVLKRSGICTGCQRWLHVTSGLPSQQGSNLLNFPNGEISINQLKLDSEKEHNILKAEAIFLRQMYRSELGVNFNK